MSRRRLAKTASSSNSLSNMNKTLRMTKRRQRPDVPVVEGAESKIHLRLRREAEVKPSTSKSERSRKMLRRLVHGASRKFMGMRKRKSIAAATSGVPTTTKGNSEMGARAFRGERSAEYSKQPTSPRRSGGSVSTLSTSSDLTPYSTTQESDSPERDEDSHVPCRSPTTGKKADKPAGDLGAPPPRRNSKSSNGQSFERGKGKGPPPPPPRRAAPNKPTPKPLREGAANQSSRCKGLPRRHSSGSLERCNVRTVETKGKRRLSSNRKKPSLEQRGLSSAFATVSKEAKARSIDAKGRKSARGKDKITSLPRRDPVRLSRVKSEPSLSAHSNRDVFTYKVTRSNSKQEWEKSHHSPEEKTGSPGRSSTAPNGRRQKGSKSSGKVADSHQRPPELGVSIVEKSESKLKQALDEYIELLEDRLELLEQREEPRHSFNDDAVYLYTARECKESPSEFNLSTIPEEESHTAKSIGSSKTDETAPSSDNSSYEFSSVERGQKSFISCDSTVKVANCMISN